MRRRSSPAASQPPRACSARSIRGACSARAVDGARTQTRALRQVARGAPAATESRAGTREPPLHAPLLRIPERHLLERHVAELARARASAGARTRPFGADTADASLRSPVFRTKSKNAGSAATPRDRVAAESDSRARSVHRSGMAARRSTVSATRAWHHAVRDGYGSGARSSSSAHRTPVAAAHATASSACTSSGLNE